jgi:hypothetical protein
MPIEVKNVRLIVGTKLTAKSIAAGLIMNSDLGKLESVFSMDNIYN